jgi:hypothetical protein
MLAVKKWLLLMLLSLQGLFMIALCPTQAQTVIGIDQSIPPSINSWRLARAYFTLNVQAGVQISFTWIGDHGITMTRKSSEYLQCTGGTVLVPNGTSAGSYIWDTTGLLGQYYFYDQTKPPAGGDYCQAGQRVTVNVSGPKACSSARTVKSCNLLTQCGWKRSGRSGKCLNN